MIIVPRLTKSCKLWIDGVGCYLICFEDEVAVGNSRPQTHSESEIRIVSNIHSKHATFNYQDESYWLQPHSLTTIDEAVLREQTRLCHGNLLSLGEDVTVRFTLPSSLSQTAILNLESSHRFEGGVDGIILFRKTCLLGSGTQKHVNCQDWEGDVVLFSRGEHLFCKSLHGEISINGEPHGREIQVVDQAHLEGAQWSMRFEC